MRRFLFPIGAFLIGALFFGSLSIAQGSLSTAIDALVLERIKEELLSSQIRQQDILENLSLGFSGNVATLATPTTTQTTGAATGSLFVGALMPSLNNQFDIGSAGFSWRNAYIDGALTVGSCTGCGGSTFGESWILTNSNLTPSSSAQGIMVSASSSFGGLVNFSQGLLSIASSTFQNGLHVNGVLNASNTLLVQTLQGFASSSFQNDLTVSRNLMVSSSLYASALSLFYNGLTGFASSSFGNDLTVSRNIMSSGTIALVDGYTARTALKTTGATILSVTTTDIISLNMFNRAVTIRSVETVTDCTSGCNIAGQAGAGLRFNLRHGTNRVASTTADSLFTNDVFAYSSSTILSFCPSGTYSTACTIQPASWGDNTLAANEILWFNASTTAGAASTTQMNLMLKIYYSED